MSLSLPLPVTMLIFVLVFYETLIGIFYYIYILFIVVVTLHNLMVGIHMAFMVTWLALVNTLDPITLASLVIMAFMCFSSLMGSLILIYFITFQILK